MGAINTFVAGVLRPAGTEVQGLLLNEGVMLDEQRWDEWLALFLPDCEFWMPMWETEEKMNADPQRQLSHIYYTSRAGLEDRVARIRSRRSPASTPIARTTHLLGGALEGEAGDGMIEARSSWACHVFFPGIPREHVFHGRSRYRLKRAADGQLRIAAKKIELMNDYIPTMLDIYCI